MKAPASPRIAVTGLWIRGFRSLRQVAWPEDGLGWGDRVPDVVLVGGANGSGKTTLLEVIFGGAAFLHSGADGIDAAKQYLPDFARDISLALDTPSGPQTLRLSTTVSYREEPRGARRWAVQYTQGRRLILPSAEALEASWRLDPALLAPGTPHILYFPTDRAVTFPVTDFKRAGLSRRDADATVYRYEPPPNWESSIEAILYDARWRDLNAKDRGHPERAIHFVAFQQAMRAFLGDTKRFVWDDDGLLHVETEDGAHHPLDALSSGEKQVLLFVAELFQRWTPGSLILIDEPELHLHESWLAGVWQAICRLQRERGGQVILTTQSNYLFGLGEPGSRVLLGGPL